MTATMYFETSPQSTPSSSPSSAPISIGFSVSPAVSIVDSFSQSSSSSKTSCAYPSWPTGSSLSTFGSSAPSSFISDEDLFGNLLDDEITTPFLKEAPAPPRPVPMAQAFPLLPLYASDKSKSKKRRNSRKQTRRSSKPMTPISESPEAPE